MKLEQKAGLFGRESFLLLEDKVRVESANPFRRTEFALNYSEMHENPVRTRHVPIAAFVLGGCLWVAAAASLATAIVTTDSQLQTLGWTAFSVMTLVGLIVLLAAWRRCFDVVIFRGMAGNCVLRTNRPTREAFTEFIAELQKRIADSRSIERRTIASVLEVLHRQGIIDDWQHQQLRSQFEINR